MGNFENRHSDTVDTHEQSHPLSGLVQSLTEVVTSSEDDFISLGMNLQKVQMMSSSQRKKITAAMDLFKEDGKQGVLQQISRYVEHSQETTQTAQQTASGLCSNLSTMLQLMDSIARKSHTLERSGMFLRVIGINTGVECARYAAMEQMFKVVSTDTIHLSEQIRVATDQLLDQTAKAKVDQSQTLAEARQSIESLEELVQGSKQATESALEKVAELINYSITTVNEAERIALTISSEINRVVVGIQFHDNLRQRIEHVNAALLETVALSDDSSAEEVGNTYLMIELQKAQLDHLIDELDSLYATQSQALRNIIGEVSRLRESLKSMASEQPSLTAGQNPVQVLIKGISALEDLNSDSQSLGEKIRASAEHAEQIVDDMQTAIKNTYAIATHVKINALNAIIKAAKFGHSGEAMQVLAQSMVTVASDTRSLVAVFEQLLSQLRSLAQPEEQSVVAMPEADLETFDSTRMQQLFQDFRSELQTSRQDCQALAASLEKEHQQLLFIAGLKEALLQFSELLGNYAASIAPEDDEMLARLRTSFGEQMQSRYTMDKERDIHNQIKAVALSSVSTVASTAPDNVLFFDDFSAPATSASTSTQDNVDLWDSGPSAADSDVELWGDEPTAQIEATDDIELWDQPSPVSAAEGSSVELWDDAPTSTSHQAAEPQGDDGDQKQQKKKEEDFGDNVELF